MKGWVGLVGWPVADELPTLVVTHQLQVKRRTGKVRRPETDVLPLSHATKSIETKGKVLSWEYRCPRKRNLRPPVSLILCWVSWVENVLLIYYASSDLFVYLHWKCLFKLEKNPQFTAFLDSNFHTRVAIVTENLDLLFPLGTFPKNFVQIRPCFI